jgi:uncharacterized membrane protein
MYQARQPRKMITNEAEKREQSRTLIYSLVFIVVVLIVGFVAGVVDQAIHSSSADRNQNYFLINAQDILLIVASMAPWAVLFFLICVAWTYITNRLFTKWNTALADDENDEAYGKGLVYEIVHDNNAAAALVLIMPMLVIAVALIFIVILIKQ